MNVAIIGSRGYPYIYSGYETLIKELSERFVKKNIKVTVYCHKGLFVDRPKTLNNIDLVYIPTIQTKSLSQLVHSFLSFFHCCFHKPDVLLVVNVANGPFGIITKIFGIPTVLNVDGLEWLRPKWKGLGSKYFKFAAKLATMLYDEIVTDSEQMKKVYIQNFDRRSTVITYGPNKSFKKKSNILRSLNLTQNEYFLIIGRLIPDNNVSLMVKEFIKSNTSKKLVVVGDVPYKDPYSQNLKNISNPKIILTGYINDELELADLYKNSFGYIHGHEFGGTNPTMINALNYGCYILALDTLFNREMLSDGKYGLFFSKTEGSLEKLINDTNNNIRKDLKNKVLKDGLSDKYDWDKISNKYVNIFRNLIDNCS